MAHEISLGIRHIIDSFLNGIDGLSKLRSRNKRLRKTKLQQRVDDDSTRLSRSLRQGSHELDWEYRRGMHALGEHFSRGDSTAQSDLMNILLRLNTGLVNIISGLLGQDKRRQYEVNYNALTSLSEASRHDSLNVLRRLYQRLVSPRLPRQIAPAYDHRRVRRQAKIRGPTIAQITVEGSKKSQLAMVKPVQRKSLASSTPNLNKIHSHSSSTTAIDSMLSSKSRQPHKKRPQAIDAPPSAAPARPGSKSTPNLLRADPDRPVPPPLPTRPQPPQRARPPTMYSITTDSTKLGEIPMHKWPVPYDFSAMSIKNREAMESGWPLVDLDGNTVYKPKKRRGFFGLFSRKTAD